MTSKWFRERREREGSKERLEADSRAVMVWIQSWSELSDFSHGLNSQISVIVWFLRLWILNQISDMIWILTQISVMLWIVTRSADFSQQFRFQSWYDSWSETRSESHFGFLFNHRVLTRQLDLTSSIGCSSYLILPHFHLAATLAKSSIFCLKPHDLFCSWFSSVSSSLLSKIISRLH